MEGQPLEMKEKIGNGRKRGIENGIEKRREEKRRNGLRGDLCSLNAL